jgi:hypothetical protein
MSDQGSDDQVAQRRDELLRRLLQTPPQSRAELSEQVRRAKGKATRTRTSKRQQKQLEKKPNRKKAQT